MSNENLEKPTSSIFRKVPARKTDPAVRTDRRSAAPRRGDPMLVAVPHTIIFRISPSRLHPQWI